jgi:hypothetical protein
VFTNWGPVVFSGKRAIRMGRTERCASDVVIDCAGLQRIHGNLVEVQSDVSDELARSGADATIHLINLTDGLLEEYQKANLDKAVRCSGLRMLDERPTYGR